MHISLSGRQSVVSAASGHHGVTQTLSLFLYGRFYTDVPAICHFVSLCHVTANFCASRTSQLQIAQSKYLVTSRADIVQVVRYISTFTFILKPQCQRGRPSHVTPYPYLQFTTCKNNKCAI